MSMDEKTQKEVDELMKLVNVSKEGYAGILPNGNIVDRREHTEAKSIPKNTLFGIPEPKDIALGGLRKTHNTIMNGENEVLNQKGDVDPNATNETTQPAEPQESTIPAKSEEGKTQDAASILPETTDEEKPSDDDLKHAPEINEQPNAEEEPHVLLGELVEVHRNNNEKFPTTREVVKGHIVNMIDDMAEIMVPETDEDPGFTVYNVKEEKNCQGNGHSFFRLLPEGPAEDQTAL